MSAVELDSHGPFDPEFMDADLDPAIVHLASGAEAFVAHHQPRAGGWLSLVGWCGSRVVLPPQRVTLVDTIETATDGALDTRQRIVDDDLRQAAERVIETGGPDLAEGLAGRCGGGGQR